jgi:hypothetical protein
LFVGLLVALALGDAPAARASFQPLDLRVDGGEENWHAQRQFALRWSNPPGVAAVHYRVLAPDGGVAIEQTTLDWPATSIQHVSVPPMPGAYVAEVWLEQADGALGEVEDATLRFDDSRPADVQVLSVDGWIGRNAFPYPIQLSHPAAPLPLAGIRGYAVSVDGLAAGSPCAGPAECSDAETDLRGGIDADLLSLGELPEGVSFVHTVAVSGSGVPSATPGSTVLRVDKTDPAVRLDGDRGSSWSNEALTLRVTANDAASGMEASGASGPFTAIRIDAGAPTTAPGNTVAASVIASGVHTVSYYARDAAGNLADGAFSNGKPNPAPATATVRIDRESPLVAFAPAQDPLDPERIEARASDSLSGLAPGRASIAVRPAGSGERFQALPTELHSGLLRVRWDSDSYPPGEYEFRTTVHDVAGNAASSLSRGDGRRMLLRAPLKVATKIFVGSRDRTVPYGRGTWFGGRLIAARRVPIADAAVKIVERFQAGAVPRERASTARTAADGSFGVHLPPGPSRQVIAIAPPSGTVQGTTSKPLELSVHSRVGLRVSARHARVGGAPVVFSGRVGGDGAAIPADGKTVQLQFRLPGLPWSEFRTVRTDGRGRFRYPYRFTDDDSRGVRFQFRAYAPAQAGWPFEPAGSLPVTVQGV